MLKRIAILLLMVAVSGVLWFSGQRYPFPEIMRAFWSFVALAALYFTGKIVLEEVLVERISGYKTRYMVRKTVSALTVAVSLLVIITIWVPNPTALVVAYGLVGAGIAVSLQDVFRNLAGGLAIFISGIYSVGDRVEMDGLHGDVIDVGPSYTTLLEIREWVDGDQATGRTVTVPNGRVLDTDVNNYTENNSFIWDEIAVPLTYDSDREEAERLVQEIVEEETSDVAERAESELEDIQKRYYVASRDTAPTVFMSANDNWVTLQVRYITDVEERRECHNRISRRIVDAVEDSDSVEIASETLDIVGFPGE